MSEVNVQQPLHLPPAPAIVAVREILDAIHNERESWNDFALHVDLRDLGLPDLGYVAVPISLETGQPRADTPSTIPVTVRAKRNAAAFPVFDGSIGIEGTGPSSSTLWLAGTYTAPLKGFGSILDASLFPNVARRALTNFLETIARSAQRLGEKREIDAVRHRRMDTGA